MLIDYLRVPDVHPSFSLPDARTLQGIEIRRLESAGMISLPFGIKDEIEKDQGTGE